LEVKRKLSKTIESYEELSQKVDGLGLPQKNIKPMSIVNPLIRGTDVTDVEKKDKTDGDILLLSEASQVFATDPQ
jgi:hypothetical protein